MTIAMRTVEFVAPITGAQLIEAVKTVIGSDPSPNVKFVKLHSYSDGDRYAVGQKGHYRTGDLIVAPTEREQDILPTKTYTRCVVRNFAWPYDVYPSPDSIETVNSKTIRNTRDLADRLEQYLAGIPSDAAIVWPQSVTVCAICQTILQPTGYDGAYRCDRHSGDETLVQTIGVIPT